MSKEINNEINEVEETEVIEAQEETPKKEKKSKPVAKKENVFKRVWKKFVKFCKDTVGEMKKVTWTPKTELAKNTKLVLVTVVTIAIAIAVIDTAFSYLINTVAGLIG